MLRVLFLFLVVIASVVLGPMLAGHQGYVLIQTDNYNIETSVTGLVIMLVLLFVVLLAIEWILRRIVRTGARTRGWFIGRKRTRARQQTKAALIKLAEGDYKPVEKLMTRNADHAEQPVVNFLLAAEAAQQRGDDFRTNQYLERAAEAADTDQLPVDITRVRIQLAQGENCVAAGNMLANPQVITAMTAAFEAATGELASRLIAALQAGIDAGGEAGPEHSAALKVVEDYAWPVVDLRVDWAEERPVAALEALWLAYEPQMEAYITRALDPREAPTYGVPGDE